MAINLELRYRGLFEQALYGAGAVSDHGSIAEKLQRFLPVLQPRAQSAGIVLKFGVLIIGNKCRNRRA